MQYGWFALVMWVFVGLMEKYVCLDLILMLDKILWSLEGTLPYV